MPQPEWERIRSVFFGALDLPASERAAFVRRECGQDQILLAEVQKLLAHEAAAPPNFVEPIEFPSDSLTGRQLGDYLLHAEIGRGAHGVVHAATQQSLQRPCAIKVLATDPLTTQDKIERFHREVRSVAKLNHAGIVRVLAEGVDDGLRWFAMELVDGTSLDQRIEDATVPIGAPGQVTRAVRIVAQIAEALAHAHEHGVVHRDVKPSNVLIDATGNARLVDFGIARDEQFGTLTQTDHVLGSLPYMSPEQARVVRQPVDERTDIYSAAVILYEMLGGRRPFEGSTSVEVLANLQANDPPQLERLNRAVPRDLAAICRQAMHRDPAQRYASARAFAEDLQRFLNHEAVLARHPTWLDRTKRFASRHKTALWLLAAVAITVPLAVWGTNVSAANRYRQELLDPIRAVHQLEDWENLPDSQLVELRERLSELNTLRKRLTPSERTLLASVLTRLERRGTELRRAASARISRIDFERPQVQLRELYIALKRMLASAAISGDHEFDEQWLSPQLTIRDRRPSPTPATVSVRVLDPTTGELDRTVEVGQLPVEGHPIPNGFVRIRIDDGSPTPREFTRWVLPAASISIDCRPLPDSATTEMVMIPGGRFEYDPRLSHSEKAPDRVVEDFWIDRYEVTNRQYRVFLRSDAARPFKLPDYWSQVLPGSRDDDLPVTSISWEAARAYAEWAGKRLPTISEWTWAARGGNEARPYPWDSLKPLAHLAKPEVAPGARSSTQHYFQLMQPVDSHPAAATSNGLYWMHGNAEEWTETIVTEAVPTGGYRWLHRSRFAAGFDWFYGWNYDLTVYRKAGVGPAIRPLLRGFRCAATAVR